MAGYEGVVRLNLFERKHKCVDCGVNTYTHDIDDNGQKIYRCMPCWIKPLLHDIKLGVKLKQMRDERK